MRGKEEEDGERGRSRVGEGRNLLVIVVVAKVDGDGRVLVFFDPEGR